MEYLANTDNRLLVTIEKREEMGEQVESKEVQTGNCKIRHRSGSTTQRI